MTMQERTGVATFRPARLEDLEAIYAVRMSVIENTLDDPSRAPPEMAASYIITIGRSFVAEIDGEIVGFSMVNRTGYVWALFVRPEFEGRGVGGRLLALCVEFLREQGVPRAFLDTGPGTRADRFYALQGWRETARDAKRVDYERTIAGAPLAAPGAAVAQDPDTREAPE